MKNGIPHSREPIGPASFLRQLIALHNLSIKGVAEQAKLTRAHVSRILNGKIGITHETALALEQVFDYPAEMWCRLNDKFILSTLRAKRLRQAEDKILTGKDIQGQNNDGVPIKTTEALLEEKKERTLSMARSGVYSFRDLGKLAALNDELTERERKYTR